MDEAAFRSRVLFPKTNAHDTPRFRHAAKTTVLLPCLPSCRGEAACAVVCVKWGLWQNKSTRMQSNPTFGRQLPWQRLAGSDDHFMMMLVPTPPPLSHTTRPSPSTLLTGTATKPSAVPARPPCFPSSSSTTPPATPQHPSKSPPLAAQDEPHSEHPAAPAPRVYAHLGGAPGQGLVAVSARWIGQRREEGGEKERGGRREGGRGEGDGLTGTLTPHKHTHAHDSMYNRLVERCFKECVTVRAFWGGG